MKFNFIANALKGTMDAPLTVLFKDTDLDVDKLRITPFQYYELFDSFKGKPNLSISFLHAHILDFLFTNAGGSEDTKTVDVMAFCYVTLRTIAFRFEIFVK